MEWYVVLAGMIAVLMVLFLAGMPVAFAFLLANVGGIYLFMGGREGLTLLVTTAFASVASFVLLPIPLFILMGELMFHSGLATRAMDALDKWIGRVPGRLSLLAVGSGTVFAAPSGSSMATTAMLASTLVPERSFGISDRHPAVRRRRRSRSRTRRAARQRCAQGPVGQRSPGWSERGRPTTERPLCKSLMSWNSRSGTRFAWRLRRDGDGVRRHMVAVRRTRLRPARAGPPPRLRSGTGRRATDGSRAGRRGAPRNRAWNR